MNFIFLILGTICFLAIFKIISMLYRYYVTLRKLRDIPSNNKYFNIAMRICNIGETLLLMRLNPQERMAWYLKYLERFKNGIFVEWIGIVPAVHIYKPEYLAAIFASTVNIDKGEFYNVLFGPWLNKGLFTSTGKQWVHARKLIGPTFHFNILDQFAIVFSEKAEILVKCIEKEIQKKSGKAIDIFPLSINVALDIICETAMGVNVRAQEEEIEYIKAMHKTTTLSMRRLFRPWYWLDWIYYLSPMGREYKSLLNTLHEFTKSVIKKKKAARQLHNDYIKTDNKDNNIGKREKKPFLDLLLDQNEKDDAPFTDDELRAQVDTFMFGGHDTTAVAMTWTLFCLGNNLEHQEKVHEELEEVFKNSDAPANMKELSQLKYLERVIKESLRIFPSAPIISRQIREDIKMDNYTIPAGTKIEISVILTHRNPEIWPDPMKFDPDRFLPENTKHRSPYAYIPFSAGPRNCVGQRFALLEEKILLTAVLRKWRVKSTKTMSEIRYASIMTLRPCEEILLQFTPKK